VDQLGEPPSVSDVPPEFLQMVPEISYFIRQESGCGLRVSLSGVADVSTLGLRRKHTLHFRTASVMRIRRLGESSDDSSSILERDAFGVGVFQGNYSSKHPGFEPFDRDHFVMSLLQSGHRKIPMGERGNRMEGRELGQSIEDHLLLPLSNTVVQMLGHGNGTQRAINGLGLLQVLLGDDDLRKVTVGPFHLGSGSVSNDDVRTLGFGEFLSLSAFGEVFFLDSPCSPPSEGCDLDNSGGVERRLRAGRGDCATERAYFNPNGQYNTSNAHIGSGLRVTAALNIVVGVERNGHGGVGQEHLPN